MTERYSTGVRFLDAAIGGGVPAGSVVTIEAPSGSQSSVLVDTYLAERPTLYVSTIRPAAEIHDYVETTVGDVDLEVVTPERETVLDAPEEVFGDLPDGGNVVIDPLDELEVGDRDRYLAALNELAERVRDADGIGVLHAGGIRSPPSNRSLTKLRSDVVFSLHEQFTSRNVLLYLTVDKLRGGECPSEPLKVRLSDHVTIDTSHDI